MIYAKCVEVKLVAMGTSTCNRSVLFLKIVVEDWTIFYRYQYSCDLSRIIAFRLQHPPYDSVKRLNDLDLIFESKWSKLVKNAWIVCHAATAASAVLSIAVALIMGHSISV